MGRADGRSIKPPGRGHYVAERERTLIFMCLVSRNAVKPSGPTSILLPHAEEIDPLSAGYLV
jgi:hypothetical protein